MNRTTLSTNQIVDEWLSEKVVGKDTKSKYRKNMGYWFRFLSRNRVDVRNAKRSDVANYLNEMIELRKSAYTIDSYLYLVRNFYRFIEEKNYGENIAKGVTGIRKKKAMNKLHLTAEQVKRLLESVPRDTITGIRDHALITLLITTGIRAVEASRLRLSDFSELIAGEGTVPVINVQRKGSNIKDDYPTIDAETVKLIDNYAANRGATIGDDEPLFISHRTPRKSEAITTGTISHIIKRYLRKIGLDSHKYSCHSLRHTHAILSIKNGIDLRHVSEQLGHRNLNTVRVYAEIAVREKYLLANPAKTIRNIIG